MNNTEEDFKKLLKEILGDEAINGIYSFQISPNVKKLAKALNYLEFQFRTSHKFFKDRPEHFPSHIEGVLEKLNEILEDA